MGELILSSRWGIETASDPIIPTLWFVIVNWHALTELVLPEDLNRVWFSCSNFWPHSWSCKHRNQGSVQRACVGETPLASKMLQRRWERCTLWKGTWYLLKNQDTAWSSHTKEAECFLRLQWPQYLHVNKFFFKCVHWLDFSSGAVHHSRGRAHEVFL